MSNWPSYTPQWVVRVLVEMLAPYKGRVYDPCCGSGGMFVSSEKFIEAHSGRIGDIAIYGQESNYTTWRLSKMNLAIRGIEAQITHGDSFHNDQHPDLKADFVLANPPFNDSDWRGDQLKDDKRWKYGVPPAGTPTSRGSSTSSTIFHRLAPRASCWPTAPWPPIGRVKERKRSSKAFMVVAAFTEGRPRGLDLRADTL